MESQTARTPSRGKSSCQPLSAANVGAGVLARAVARTNCAANWNIRSPERFPKINVS
jgi:hypothetical protein